MVKNILEKLPGRWYQVFIESDGSAATITTIDDDIELAAIVSNINLKLPANFSVLDYKMDIHADASGTYTPSIKTYATDQESITLPPVAAYDYLTVYIYGYYTE